MLIIPLLSKVRELIPKEIGYDEKYIDYM